MPKKIKKEKNVEYRKEKLINVDNIHIVFIALAIFVILVCLAVGIYVFHEDKSHPNKENAIVKFVYTETLDEGYNVFSIQETDAKKIFVEYNSLDEQEIDEISRGKYLDFNEEIYNSNILENMNTTEQKDEYIWSIYVEYLDGTEKYIYDSDVNATNIDKNVLSEIILKYFNKDILYK